MRNYFLISLTLLLVSACTEVNVDQNVGIKLPPPAPTYSPDAGSPPPTKKKDGGKVFTKDGEIIAPDQHIPPLAPDMQVQTDQHIPPLAPDMQVQTDQPIPPLAPDMQVQTDQHIPDAQKCLPVPAWLKVNCYDKKQANGKSWCDNKFDPATGKKCWSQPVWLGESVKQCGGQVGTVCSSFTAETECCYGDSQYKSNRQCYKVCGHPLTWVLNPKPKNP